MYKNIACNIIELTLYLQKVINSTEKSGRKYSLK